MALLIAALAACATQATGDEKLRIEVLLDGKLVASSLEARIAASDGTVMRVSPPVTFHLWRASRLSPGRKN